jgi:hypothetical protein
MFECTRVDNCKTSTTFPWLHMPVATVPKLNLICNLNKLLSNAWSLDGLLK